MFKRRRCVVCGRHISRSGWRARVVVDGKGWRRPAHWWCVVPDDAMIQRFTEGAQ